MIENGARDELLDAAVIGGGQAGLAMAWQLAQHRLRFVVLEAGPELGHTWRSRWDSLTLFTPTQYNSLPGMPFPGAPDTYPGKDAVAAYLASRITTTASAAQPARQAASVAGSQGTPKPGRDRLCRLAAPPAMTPCTSPLRQWLV